MKNDRSTPTGCHNHWQAGGGRHRLLMTLGIWVEPDKLSHISWLNCERLNIYYLLCIRVFPPYVTGSGKRTQIPFPMLSTFPHFFCFRKTHENKFELVKIVLGNYFRYQKFNSSLWNLLKATHAAAFPMSWGWNPGVRVGEGYKGWEKHICFC